MDEEGPPRLGHLHHDKDQIGNKRRNKNKWGPQTLKPDNLIAYFCRNLDNEKKNVCLACRGKLFGQTQRQTEGDWQTEIARVGGEVFVGLHTIKCLWGEWWTIFKNCFVHVTFRRFCQSLPWSTDSCGREALLRLYVRDERESSSIAAPATSILSTFYLLRHLPG